MRRRCGRGGEKNNMYHQKHTFEEHKLKAAHRYYVHLLKLEDWFSIRKHQLLEKEKEKKFRVASGL